MFYIATMAMNYYQILGVSKDASFDDIKKAYRGLALKCHPDVNASDPDTQERFRDITEAYGVLIDPEKRRSYDRTGHPLSDQQSVFDDIFSRPEYRDVFNNLPLRDEWVQKILSIGRVVAYEALVYGGRPSAILRRSAFRMAVQGAGSVFHNVMDIHRNIEIPQSFASKGGYVTIEYRPGFSSKRLKVHVPENVRQGMVLRIPGKGRKNWGAKAGDLFLQVDMVSV
ncbi:MAG: DnaJ domain-containing protein [Thermodesulfobacteriota bacterium]|nr:DnaJ domain-containing protein [Thermodesulfobacteriota bacterium]